MANDNGNITAPVNIDDVKKTLGLNIDDVGALCISDKINPYSLIRPIPAENPWVEAKDMITERIGEIPDSTENYAWERKLWGYQVPYVRNPALIDEIKDIPWYRPNADMEHWKSLNHFDGYRHNVIPTFMWAVGDVKPNDEIRVVLAFGSKQNDIISDNGKGNDGGVVSVIEVFGDSPFYYGVKIKYGSFFHFAYGGPVVPGQATSGVINTGLLARANTTYEITPFISNKEASQVTSDLQVYNLKFAPDFESTKTIVIPEIVTGVTIRALSIDNTDGHILTWELHIFNEYSVPYETEQIELTIIEQGRSNIYPLRRTMFITAESVGLSSFRVEAQDDALFTIDRPITWYAAASSISATIVGSGTLHRVPSGNAQPFSTNIMIMENPQFLKI